MSYKSLITALLLILGSTGTALAAGTSSDSTSPPEQLSTYDRAVQAVKEGDYRLGLRLLDEVTTAQPRNADAWNYMGFSYRQLNDYDQALAAYEKALAINPDHRGANEYLGELYLKMGKVDKAKQRLEVLDKACFFGCEEYDELKAAIAAYKSG